MPLKTGSSQETAIALNEAGEAKDCSGLKIIGDSLRRIKK